uniref:Uncharacterized protein n=1 Tax=Oryza nivara TaxID=4536 RepID=A0A0E0G1X6_ORYNI
MATAATTTRSLSLHAHALPSPTTGTAETLSSLILHLPPVSGARRQGLRAVAFPSKQGCRPKKEESSRWRMLLRSCRRLRKGSYLSPTRRMDTPSSTHLDDRQILHIDDWSKRKEMEKMKNRLHTEVQLMRFDVTLYWREETNFLEKREEERDERSDTIDIDKEASSEQATTADGNLQYAGGEPAIDGASGH